MKTEDFDDAIRRKIDRLDFPYEEKDIDRVHDYVNQKRESALKRSFGFIAASLSIILISGLFTWNLMLRHDHKQLLLTIDSLRKNSTQTDLKLSPVNSNTLSIKENKINKSNNQEPVESKTTNENRNSLMASKENIPLNHPSDQFINRQSGSLNENDLRQNQETNLKSKQALKKNVRDKNAMVQNNFSINPIVDSQLNQSGNDNGSNEKITVKDVSTKNEAGDSKANSTENKINSIVRMPDNLVEKQIKSTVDFHDTLPLENNSIVMNDANNEKVKDTLPVTKEKQRKSFLFLKNWHYLAGVRAEIAIGQSGYSIVGEIIFNRKWSVTSGIEQLTIKNESYDDDNDFHHQKNQYFNHVYDGHVTDTSSNSEIKIHTLLVQVPLILTYHIALKNNYSLSVSSGTEIDLYAKQDVDYKHKLNTPDDQHKNFDTNEPTVIFNNILLSAGVRKQWKCFAFEAGPFIKPQLKSVIYKKENLYYGFDLKALYAFGR